MRAEQEQKRSLLARKEGRPIRQQLYSSLDVSQGEKFMSDTPRMNTTSGAMRTGDHESFKQCC